ncbi:Sedlin, N-terminal conserved region-domain-containing protein [Papiliotrema laurentii]|uniref:Sedlin, N-terminal conserved region-domain-containing protein n=1 Tax=Papiliotrema laurentii TaxID=5418 RepID=A0AAD9FRK6_PAPLA|nr:Sedlin, N-terminal conserved region-domain-containing protein [Papiliotrema laurentii]
MEARTPIPLVPLHLTSLTILSPTNTPLYVHSFTGPQDELRHYHLSHAAIDVIEERIVMTSTPTKPADSYLGLLFCMEDMALSVYGFQTTTKLRMVLSVALVDAMIKDADIVAIFRAVHQLLLSAIHNPFLSLPPSFKAAHAPAHNGPLSESAQAQEEPERAVRPHNPPIPTDKMFITSPEGIEGDWLKRSGRFQSGMKRIGELLSGGRV